jgi:hypothetical protein
MHARRLATGEHPGGPQFVQASNVKAGGWRENPAVSSAVQTPAVDGYRPKAAFLDELFEPDGVPRPTAGALVEVLRRLGPKGLIEAGRRRDARTRTSTRSLAPWQQRQAPSELLTLDRAVLHAVDIQEQR